jgi:hypothetical protein
MENTDDVDHGQNMPFERVQNSYESNDEAIQSRDFKENLKRNSFLPELEGKRR